MSSSEQFKNTETWITILPDGRWHCWLEHGEFEDILFSIFLSANINT